MRTAALELERLRQIEQELPTSVEVALYELVLILQDKAEYLLDYPEDPKGAKEMEEAIQFTTIQLGKIDTLFRDKERKND
jgi:hypothetical protein